MILYWPRIGKKKMKRNLKHYNKIVLMKKQTIKIFNSIES